MNPKLHSKPKNVIVSLVLKIRLQRIGKRGQAYFRVAVVEHTTRPKGKYLELLGSYDPHKNEIKVDGERIRYWLTKGAKLSGTVNNLLVERKIIEGEKVKVWKPKSKKKKEEKTAPAAKTEELATPTSENKEEKIEVKATAQPEKNEEPVKEESAENEKKETTQQKAESVGSTANQ